MTLNPPVRDSCAAYMDAPTTSSRRIRIRMRLLIVLMAPLSWACEARPIDLIVIHATGGPDCRQGRLWHAKGGTLESNLRHFSANPQIGFHYLIGRDGKTVAGAPESKIANHALGHNQTSIGIELVNDGDGKDPFPGAQVDALIRLLKRLATTYGLSVEQTKSHSEIDERAFVCGGKSYKRKIDPGGEYPGSPGNFPWQRVRDALK
jgi:N-acetylmuramoyl-L-alanine amidase